MTRKEHDEWANRLRLILNQHWTRYCEDLVRQAVEIDADPGFITDAMLSVAIGQVAASKGFRGMAEMLGPIAANFERLADQVDAAMARAGAATEKSQVRH